MPTVDHARPWAHVPYEKMAEGPDRWSIDEAGHRALARTPWVVTEKIHGASFCLVTDGLVVRAAKRRAMLDEGEDFFGHLSLMPRLSASARRAFSLCAEACPGLTRLAIHGELFGGGYPHPEVAPVPGVQPVQTGVYYAPGVELCVFDLAADLPEGRRYLDFDLALRVGEEAGFFCARPLFTGRYEQALQHPLGFESTVPARLGLPPLPSGNTAEGVVVKPSRAVVVAGKGGPVRPVLKRKIARFAEDARYHGAEAWQGPRPSPRGPELGPLEARLGELAVEARLHAAISKVGPCRPGDERRRLELVDEIARDLLASLDDDQPAAFASLEVEGRARLAALAQEQASELVAIWLSLQPALPPIGPGPLTPAGAGRASIALMNEKGSVRVCTLTFSDTRTEADDEGGKLLGSLLTEAGHQVLWHAIAREDVGSVEAAVERALGEGRAQAVICTGGTGIAARDVAAEAIEARLDKALPGFGEAFRRLSWEQVGPRSILSRAVAGTARGKLVVALPGSLKAVRLGVVEVLLPVLPHAVDLLEGRTGHGHRVG